mmetsp:Transcript_17202/g.30312  ORF Transcript_17202/g.30312 Transcript_17202/m.30312 type:complete len:110 (-) Transcript_17202:910-1239(-)
MAAAFITNTVSYHHKQTAAQSYPEASAFHPGQVIAAAGSAMPQLPIITFPNVDGTIDSSAARKRSPMLVVTTAAAGPAPSSYSPKSCSGGGPGFLSFLRCRRRECCRTP